MASTQADAEPVKLDVTDQAEISTHECCVTEVKPATNKEPEVVVHDDEEEEEEEEKEGKTEDELDEENEEEKLADQYSPITGEEEPNATFNEEVEGDDLI